MKTQRDGIKEVTLTFETKDVSLNNLKMEASKTIGDLFVKSGESAIGVLKSEIKIGDYVQSVVDRPQAARVVKGQTLSVVGFEHEGQTVVVKDYNGAHWYIGVEDVDKVFMDALVGSCVGVLSSGNTCFSEGGFGIIDRYLDRWNMVNVIAKNPKTGTLVTQAMELNKLRLV